MAAKEHTYTLGIEEEFAIIDPETRELRSHIQEILEGGKVTLKEQIKPEMHQSVVELGTEICQSIGHARTHVVELRSKLADLASQSGLKIASVGTHPFSHWRDQLITEGERYQEIRQRHAIVGPGQSDFWAARARRNTGSRLSHSGDESGALFSASHLRAFGQLAFLGGTGYRPEGLPAQSLRAFPPHRHSRFV